MFLDSYEHSKCCIMQNLLKYLGPWHSPGSETWPVNTERDLLLTVFFSHVICAKKDYSPITNCENDSENRNPVTCTLEVDFESWKIIIYMRFQHVSGDFFSYKWIPILFRRSILRYLKLAEGFVNLLHELRRTYLGFLPLSVGESLRVIN